MLGAALARRSSLKPQLNQIRIWARQGRTDIWIAHTLESTPEAIRSFRIDNGLLRPGEPAPAPPPARAAKPEGETSTRRRRRTRAAAVEPEAPPEEPAPEPETAAKPARRRGRRGRSGGAQAEEAVAGAIVRGVAIQLPESVLADPAFREHWDGVQAVTAEIGPETIVLRRA
jgi:hypothetical protein